MSIELTIAVRVALCIVGAALAFTGLCRARLMSERTTYRLIRYAAAAQATSGVMLMLCATVRPDWAVAALILAPSAALLAQAASARYWLHGLPPSFRLPATKEIQPGLLCKVAGGCSKR